MRVCDGKHFDLYRILPYQRNFNLINSVRSTGKTYTTQFYLLDKAIEKNIEFINIVRTKSQLNKNVFQKQFEKVIHEQYPNRKIKFTKDTALDVSGEVQKILGYCIALSSVEELKLTSFPGVDYMLFDEYVIEPKSSLKYVRGWDEPEYLLNLYHTVDRETDRVKVFMLANNIQWYNPYHIHPAFNIPGVDPGKIWCSDNVLFWNYLMTDDIKNIKENSKFINMIQGTQYSEYAQGGKYIFDNETFVKKMTGRLRCDCVLTYEGDNYGVFTSLNEGIIYLSDSYDPSCRFKYALTLEDHRENTLLTRSKNITHLNWLSKNFKMGNVRYTSQAVKTKLEKGISMIL